MSKKSIFSRVGLLITSALILSGCAYGFNLTTPASCPVVPIAGGDPIEVPLDIQLSDNSPVGNQALSISVVASGFNAEGLDVNSQVIVEHATGFYRPGGINSLLRPQTPSSSPSPSPSDSSDPLAGFYSNSNPEFIGFPLSYENSLSNNYASPGPLEAAAVFRPLSTDDVDRVDPNDGPAWWNASSFPEKISLTAEELNSSNSSNLQQNRLVVPGIISVRCIDDEPGTIRAAKAIYPNYIDGSTPLVFDASEDVHRELSGTLTLPTELPYETGRIQAVLFSDQQSLFAGEMPDSISSLWLKLIALETQGDSNLIGKPLMLLGDETQPFGNGTIFSNRQVPYRIGTFGDYNDASNTVYRDTRPPAGDFWLFTVFTPTLSDSEVVDANLVRIAFFKVTISESGTTVTSTNVSNLPLDFEAATEPSPVAVTASVSPSITSVLPSNVSAAGGTKVTVKGSHLSGASVMVGDAPAALVSNTDGSIEFITPPSAGGKLGVTDMKLSTNAGVITAQGALTYEKAAVAPVAAAKSVIRKISGFLGGSSAILPSHKAPLKRIGAEAAKFTSANCVGFVAGGVRANGDRTLALNRAKAVCASLKSANPALKVRISTASTNLGFSAAARKVEIRLSR